MFKNADAINNNIFIYGDIGVGKTHLIKRGVESYLKTKEGKIFIIDLYGEYKDLANVFDGEIEYISSSSKNKINPFYISGENGNGIFEKEILYNKIEDLINLFYYDFPYTELNYIKIWLIEIYNNAEELTFSYLLDSINQLKIKKNINKDEILLSKWEYITMLYARSYFDCKNNIYLSEMNKNLLIFDLSHIKDIREKSILAYSILYLIWEDVVSNEGLCKSRIIIDHLELLDKGTDFYIQQIMKRSKVNNCGVILSSNNYEKLTDNNIRKSNCLSLSGTRLMMKLRNSPIELIRYDMNLSTYEIYQLENLSLGECIKFQRSIKNKI